MLKEMFLKKSYLKIVIPKYILESLNMQNIFLDFVFRNIDLVTKN